jgi:hypothetical protein
LNHFTTASMLGPEGGADISGGPPPKLERGVRLGRGAS